MRAILQLLMVVVIALPSNAQISLSQVISNSGLQKAANDGITSVNNKALCLLQKKYSRLNASIEKQSQRMLVKLKKEEYRLKNIVAKQDSVKAIQLFKGMDDRYDAFKDHITRPRDSLKPFPLREYIPGADSLQAALNFLRDNGVSLPQNKLEAVSKAGSELNNLEDRLQKATEIESFVRERERQLKAQLQNSGLARQLKGINKEAFYYGQRLNDYKEILRNPEKAEQKLLSAVRNSHAFQAFMQKNSYLAKLFPIPENYGTPEMLAGLQTRAGVQRALQERFGNAAGITPSPSQTTASAGNPAGYLQKQIASAQAQLSQLKNKVGRLGLANGSADMTMPDFNPNPQHTKSFLQRIEYGANVQSEGAKYVLPATSEVALTLGYKLNTKSTVGVGASYRVGWGHEGLKHITITNEGVGLRSYLDFKAKGSFWLSGGYEMNYQQSFAKYRQLYNFNMWQQSGLIGITKKYKAGKIQNSVQLLWDFLSYRQVPKAQPVKFRIGFGL